ncbi:chemotaxis protein CheW [Marasmitruncus massiliensis]|uniref:chemotaxis protein CheW n=1 Tax=Marasmitruncus massiliensis TaxID=1944642 RepID=UPI000C7E7353|nr:chemotaxis protein CheW [Marasmitruncus massiliensis]
MEENIVSTVMDDLQGKFLTFHIEDTIYGIELLHVIEIISIQNATRIPNVPTYIKGIINLRGKIVPVIDVRLKFKQSERVYDEKTCIIVVVIEDMQVGLIVDRVSEVVTVDQAELANPPELGTTSNEKYLQSIATVGEKVVLNIDCHKFFHSDLNYTKI